MTASTKTIPSHHKNMRIGVGAIIHHQEKFLILKEKNKDPFYNKDFHYKIPQGGMDPGEDEVTALKREVREELQIELTDDNIKRKIGQYAYTVNTEGLEKDTLRDDGLDGQILSFYEVVLTDEQRANITPNQEEGILDIEWIPMSKRYSYLNSYRMQAYNNALTDWYYQDRVFRPAGRPVIFNQQGLVLITKMKDLWAIPGGGLDWGESLATNIARESFEELGVQADIDQIIFIQDYLAEKPPLGWHHLEYFYSIKNNEDFENILETYQTASHTHELDELMWCDIDSFPENFMPQALIPALKQYTEHPNNFTTHYSSQIDET